MLHLEVQGVSRFLGAKIQAANNHFFAASLCTPFSRRLDENGRFLLHFTARFGLLPSSEYHKMLILRCPAVSRVLGGGQRR